jgi:hypothetical protein
MRTSILKWSFCFWLAAVTSSLVAASVSAGGSKFEAVLIWGTNDEKSPDPSHKPVSEKLAKRLKDFKWTHYFEVARKDISVDKDQKRVAMSRDCTIVIKTLENNQVEVTLVGKGEDRGHDQEGPEKRRLPCHRRQCLQLHRLVHRHQTGGIISPHPRSAFSFGWHAPSSWGLPGNLVHNLKLDVEMRFLLSMMIDLLQIFYAANQIISHVVHSRRDCHKTSG